MEEDTEVSSETKPVEAQEKKTKELLEIELESVSTALKHSESENTRLNDEILLAKEKLEETRKKHEDLELSHKKLQVVDQADVSAIQQALAVSRSREVELEQRFSLIHELTHDIRLWMQERTNARWESVAAEADAELIEWRLQDIKWMLEDEVCARESLVAEAESISKGWARVTEEVEFLTSRVDNMQQICIVNEDMGRNAEEHFDLIESLLSEALKENDELKHKITQLWEESVNQKHSNNEVEILHSQQGSDVSSAIGMAFKFMIAFGVALLVSVIIAIILANPILLAVCVLTKKILNP